MTVATDLERHLLQLMNEERAAVGLPPLTLELNLNRSADAHSAWMIDADTFSHTGINGTSSNQRMVSAGFELRGSWSTGENIGAQSISGSDSFYDEVEVIHRGLMNSPGHRANILDEDYTHVGLGIATGPLTYGASGAYQSVLVTQNFGNSGGTLDEDLSGSSAGETIRSTTGNDHISAQAGDDIVISNSGADTVFAGAGNDSVNGGAGNDRLMGETGNDFLRGEDGDDMLYGAAGHDFALGDGGNDTLDGAHGNDSLSGGAGNDNLSGGVGFDALQGGDGNDTLDGGAQADNLFAGIGNDLLRGGDGFDRLFGGFGDDTLEGGDGPDALFGNGGADFIFGQEGDDRSYGAGGNDFIQDAEGNDLLEAGAGFDTLDGGVGDDTLYGRFNADLFVFTDATGGFGNDTIGDFAATNQFERIDLSGVAAITDLNDLMNNHARQVGGNVAIDAGENSSITLVGVNLAQLDSTDFTF